MSSADFAAAHHRLTARRALSRKLSPPRPSHPLLSLWTTLSSREGTHPSFRVGQLDAELLDAELLSLLKDQVASGLKHFGQNISDTWGSEILLALRLVLFKLSVWNNNASYGAHLQGLRYSDGRRGAGDGAVPSGGQKVLYGVLSVGGRYAWEKWGGYLLRAEEDFSGSSSQGIKTAARWTERLESTHAVLSLASFLTFLLNGRYRTLTDRILRLRLTPTTHTTSREVSFEYLNRQLVWHAFTEFLLFLLPLVGISRWRKILTRTWRTAVSAFGSLIGRKPSSSDDTDTQPKGELASLPDRTCAICYRDQNPVATTEQDILSQSAGGGVIGSAATDITNAYEALPCGCVYCFSCIAQRIASEEGEGWPCLRCGEVIRECRPWDGDVLVERRGGEQEQGQGQGQESAHGKSVGFAAVGVEGGAEVGDGLREVEPRAEDEEQDEEDEVEEEEEIIEREVDWRDTLDESAEWARASEERSEDSQSEEYEEDEREEGDELEYDQ